MQLIWRTDSRFFSHRPLNDSFGNPLNPHREFWLFGGSGIFPILGVSKNRGTPKTPQIDHF